MQATTDSQAISAVLHGDKSSYEALIEKHKRMVYGIAWSHLGDADLSEDAAQETFIKAYTYLGTLREPDKFAGWLARIARNVCGSFRRSVKREKAFKQRWAVLEAAETEPRADERESLSQPLWQSFAELPAVHREALTAFYIEDKSVREAAVALGISEEALRARLHRARVALREHLEHNLEESLGELRPSKHFTRSVIALLPLSPKGAAGAGGGGALALLGKLSLAFSFALWMSVAAILPIWGIFTLYSRLDEASLKDTPENQVPRTIIRRGYLKAVFAMFAAFVVVWTLMAYFSARTLIGVTSLLYLYMVWRQLRVLRVNTSPVVAGGAIIWGILWLVNVLIGFFGASYWLFPAAALLAGIIAHFTTARMPILVGYNVFLRAATTGCADPPDDAPLPARITTTEMRAFARFLGGLWMLNDYKLRRSGISLIFPVMRKTALTDLGSSPGSTFTIASDGTITASLTDRDRKAIRDFTKRDLDMSDVQDQACRAIRYALSRFLEGDVDAARSVLVPPNAPQFERNPTSERNNRVKSLVTIFIGATALAEFLMPTGQLMLITAAIGFSLAGLVLGITLYITRRESRSA